MPSAQKISLPTDKIKSSVEEVNKVFEAQEGSPPESAESLKSAARSARAISGSTLTTSMFDSELSPLSAAVQAIFDTPSPTSVIMSASEVLSSYISVKSNAVIDGRMWNVNPSVSGFQAFNIEGGGPGEFTALLADFNEGDYQFQSAVAFNIGDWVYLRSQLVLPEPNEQGVKAAQIFKITDKSGDTYTVDISSRYSFLVADSAEVAPCDMRENITIKNLNLNSENYNHIYTMAVRCKFVANLVIENLHVIGTKVRYGSDVGGSTAIKLDSCVNVLVKRCSAKHIGWYGVETLGACRSIDIERFLGVDCRHTTSVNWSEEYGEPIDIAHKYCLSERSIKTGFDTHDRGKNILFFRCISNGSIEDSGFQQRAEDVYFFECEAYRNYYDGFIQRGPISKQPTLVRCIANHNMREGFSMNTAGGILLDCTAHYNTRDGAKMRGGIVRGGRYTDNDRCAIQPGGEGTEAPQKPLLIEGVTAPRSDRQTRFCYFNNANGTLPHMVTIRNNNIVGYEDHALWRAGYATVPRSPKSYGNVLFNDEAGFETSGEIQLVDGSATVSSSAIMRVRISDASSQWEFSVTPCIELKHTYTSVNAGALFVTGLNNGVFTIQSTNPDDASIIEWSVSY